MVYAAQVDDQRLTFEVAGVYRRNMIIRDHQTGTLWQHATGEALMGPLKGARLQPLGGELTRWSGWQEMNPHTTLAVEPLPDNGRYPGLIPRDRLEHLLEAFTTNYSAPGFVTDNRLPMHEEIAGLSLAGVDRAYPLALLRDRGVINDHIGERFFAVIYDADADHVIALDRLVGDRAIDLLPANSGLSSPDGMMRWTRAGSPLTANTPSLQGLWIERQWWLGWVEFHPTSEVSG
ncbi:MAG: DUF3179 domain-containing (seleno)protein [Chloroflexota bacterium]|nr:DUF3179 domain-containing (seleno)protein [Chloroflexota bacterium]